MPFPAQLRVELSPRRIEVELAAYLNRWYDQAVRKRTFDLDPLAREALEHVISRAFLAGKITAAREIRSPWQIVGNDSQVIQNMAWTFERDFERIMQDLRVHMVINGLPTPRSRMLNRFSLLAQMLTRKAYNKGKASEFKRSLTMQASVYSAAQYKWGGWFIFLVHPELSKTGVCDDCAQFAGVMSEDYDDLIAQTFEPPIHLNCYCEIVGRPTVPIVESQDRFKESWEQEQEAEQEA
jgi:hypothetical protein